jgi:hypothetical protein
MLGSAARAAGMAEVGVAQQPEHRSGFFSGFKGFVDKLAHDFGSGGALLACKFVDGGKRLFGDSNGGGWFSACCGPAPGSFFA